MDNEAVEFDAYELSELHQNGTSQQNQIQKLSKLKDLQKWLHHDLNVILYGPSIDDGLPKLESLLKDPRLTNILDLASEVLQWNSETSIPESTSLLVKTKLEPQLIRMLKNSVYYRRYLECLLTRFGAFNEKLGPTQDTPLHHAVKQLNRDFIEWLLNQDSLDPNIRNEQYRTPLFQLCEKSKQGQDVRDCILQLLDKGANFNIYSGCPSLPFELLMNDPSEENRKFLDECARRHHYGAIAIGKINEESKKRFVGFYQEQQTEVKMTMELLEVFLGIDEQDRFLKEFSKLEVNENNVSLVIRVLLHTAVKLDREEYVRKVVQVGKSQIFQPNDNCLIHRIELKGLLKKACASGNASTLKLLLDSINDKLFVNEDSILLFSLTMAQGDSRDRMLQCANTLIKSEKVDYSLTDLFGNTALHYAAKSGFKEITVELLLQKNNFLGVRNRDNLTPLAYARCEFWKYCFDKCIKRVRFSSNPDDYEIWFNYNSFIPCEFGESLKSTQNNANTIIGMPEQTTMTEMDPLKVISKSKELKSLLLHPLVQTFIQIKSKGMNTWYFFNLICMLFTLGAFSWLSWHTCNSRHPLIVPIYIFKFFLYIFGICYMLFREAVNICFLRFKYLTSVENLQGISIIVCTFLTLSTECKPILSSCIVIALVRQLTILIGFLPFKIATYAQMFNTITNKFLLSFLLFIPWFIAFTYCFYLVYSVRSDYIVPTESSNESFNTFGTFADAARKTLLMTTGEFNAASLDLKGGKIILLVMFIFFVPFVFLNLINGLAVGDILLLQKQSKLKGFQKKVMSLYHNEQDCRNASTFVKRFLTGSFLSKHHFEIQVKPKEWRKIMVKPKDSRNWEVLPIISKSLMFLHFKSKIPLFYTLDERLLDEVLKIVDSETTDSNIPN